MTETNKQTVIVETTAPLSHHERKRLFKEAMKEWMTEQREEVERTIGRWFIRMFASAAVIALMYVILWANGFVRVP